MPNSQPEQNILTDNFQLDPFYDKFKGGFSSCMRWDDLTILWDTLKQRENLNWYIYAIGEQVPDSPASKKELLLFITEIDNLLRNEHEEDYCGIVYADDKENPTLIKIYDPNNLGVSCGFSNNPPLPGWILSVIPPKPLEDKSVLTQQRKRWWQRLWNK